MGQGGTPANEVVPVNAGAGVKAGVKIRQGFPGFQDTYIPGEQAIQGGDKTRSIHAGYIGRKISDLACGVHPRIGPARTGQGNRVPVYLFQGFLNKPLNGTPAGRTNTVPCIIIDRSIVTFSIIPCSTIARSIVTLSIIPGSTIARNPGPLPSPALALPSREIRAVIGYQEPNVSGPIIHRSGLILC
jgi:hypothetical protein